MHPQGARCPNPNMDYLYPKYSISLCIVWNNDMALFLVGY